MVGWFWAKSLCARLGGKRKRNRTRGWRLCSAVFHREDEEEAEDEEQKLEMKNSSKKPEAGIIALFIGR